MSMAANITPPGGTDPEYLENKISELLEKNGTKTVEERLELIIYLLLDLYADIKRWRIFFKGVGATILWLQKHPRVTAIILIAYILLAVFHLPEIFPFLVKIMAGLDKLGL